MVWLTIEEGRNRIIWDFWVINKYIINRDAGSTVTSSRKGNYSSYIMRLEHWVKLSFSIILGEVANIYVTA